MTPTKYYKEIVLGYLVEDIEYLIKRKENRSGVILGPVFGGIDATGGSIYGYDEKVGTRFKKILEDHMNYSPAESKYIYESVRCGLVHQGTAKFGLKFFSTYTDCQRPHTIYRDNNWLYLDCVKLAKDFLTKARYIWADQRDLIKYLPGSDESGFQTLREESALKNIEGFKTINQAFLDDTQGSNSGFDFEHHLNPDIEISSHKT